jgi:hypothetical protein
MKIVHMAYIIFPKQFLKLWVRFSNIPVGFCCPFKATYPYISFWNQQIQNFNLLLTKQTFDMVSNSKQTAWAMVQSYRKTECQETESQSKS